MQGWRAQQWRQAPVYGIHRPQRDGFIGELNRRRCLRFADHPRKKSHFAQPLTLVVDASNMVGQLLFHWRWHGLATFPEAEHPVACLDVDHLRAVQAGWLVEEQFVGLTCGGQEGDVLDEGTAAALLDGERRLCDSICGVAAVIRTIESHSGSISFPAIFFFLSATMKLVATNAVSGHLHARLKAMSWK